MFYFILYIYLWLQWIFFAFLQLWLAVATLQLQCTGFSLQQLRLLWSTGSWACRLSNCSTQALKCGLGCCGIWAQLLYLTACGIFLDQGSSLCPLYWQAISNTGPPGKSKKLKFQKQHTKKHMYRMYGTLLMYFN